MYFLNDQHYQYQYGLYCRVANATPYINELSYIHDISGIYREIEAIEKKHNHYHQLFYIDHNFYKNQYNINANGTYYKFLKRPVFDWEELTEGGIQIEKLQKRTRMAT